MMKVLISALVLLQPLAAPALADFVIPPANLFRDPKFVAEFVGSYGILSDVEPRVSADEQAVLTEIRELFEKSKFDAAEQRLNSFIREVREPSDSEKEPGEVSPSMIFVLGNLYFQANRPDEARRAFLEAIRRFPRFRRAHANLGYLHISRNQPAEALPMLQKAVELGESSARAFGLIGYCHLLGKHPVAAENAYRQACLLDAESRDWNLGLAQALMAQDKNAEAASLIGTLIQRNPNDRQLWLQQTNALLAQEKRTRPSSTSRQCASKASPTRQASTCWATCTSIAASRSSRCSPTSPPWSDRRWSRCRAPSAPHAFSSITGIRRRPIPCCADCGTRLAKRSPRPIANRCCSPRSGWPNR